MSYCEIHKFLCNKMPLVFNSTGRPSSFNVNKISLSFGCIKGSPPESITEAAPFSFNILNKGIKLSGVCQFFSLIFQQSHMIQGLLQFWIICIIGVTGTHNFLRSKIESDALIKFSFFKRKPFFSSSLNKIEKSDAKISVSTLSFAATVSIF